MGSETGSVTRRVPSLLALGAILTANLRAQEAVTVVEPHDGADLQYAEPHFATNPASPSQVVLASMVINPANRWSLRAFRSTDSGATWSETTLPPLGDLRCFADPWIAWGTGETAYLVCLTRRPVPGEDDWNAAVLFYRTDDAGATWRAPLLVPDDEVRGSWDHPIARITPEGGVLVAGTRARVGPDGFAFAWYDPAAHAFEPLVSYLPPEQVNDNFGAAVPLAAGRVLFTYFTMRTGGPRPMYAVHLTPDSVTRVRMREHVTPWGFPMLSAANPGQLPTAGSMPVYATWLEEGDSGGLDVWLARSVDGGRHWSEPRRVNDAVPAFRAIPQLAVSGDGRLVVTWYDTRHASDPRSPQPCGDVYVRLLEADGSPAGPSVRITRSEGCPGELDRAGVRQRWRAGGDYGAVQVHRSMLDLAWGEPGPHGNRIRFLRMPLSALQHP